MHDANAHTTTHPAANANHTPRTNSDMTNTSANGPQSVSPEEVIEFIDKHYGHVMTPWQRDLLKRLWEPNGVTTMTPYMHGRMKSLVREAVAVISAGKRA